MLLCRAWVRQKLGSVFWLCYKGPCFQYCCMDTGQPCIVCYPTLSWEVALLNYICPVLVGFHLLLFLFQSKVNPFNKTLLSVIDGTESRGKSVCEKSALLCSWSVTEVVCFLTHVNVVEDLRASSRVRVELRLPWSKPAQLSRVWHAQWWRRPNSNTDKVKF